MNAAAVQHMWAQSRSSRMHSTIMCTSGSDRQASPQWAHSWAQRTQASMHDMNCSWAIGDSPFLDWCRGDEMGSRPANPVPATYTRTVRSHRALVMTETELR